MEIYVSRYLGKCTLSGKNIFTVSSFVLNVLCVHWYSLMHRSGALRSNMYCSVACTASFHWIITNSFLYYMVLIRHKLGEKGMSADIGASFEVYILFFLSNIEISSSILLHGTVYFNLYSKAHLETKYDRFKIFISRKSIPNSTIFICLIFLASRARFGIV